MRTGIETGFLLDELWHLLRGEMEGSKRSALLALARVMRDAPLPYAIIGGVALQFHQKEPRTTLDIDVAVVDRKLLPRDRMRAAGFIETGTFEHSENWVGPDSVPVQFTDDPALRDSVSRAQVVRLEGTELRVLQKADLLREKLRAGADPARRRSKRMQDLADAQALIEADAELGATLTAAERARLDRLL